jgi:hypothetical protein
MRPIAKAAPAAIAAPLFIATFVTACSPASPPAAPASATAASTASAAPSAPTSSAQSAPGGSFGSLTADQIAGKANADLKAAKSFRVSGALSVGGVSEGIDLTSAGDKCSGKITTGGTSERFVQIGATLWLNAGSTGMYFKTSASQNSQVFALCASDQLASAVGPLTGLTKDGTAVVGGRRVEKLSDAASGSIDVTISGTPEYVRFAVPGETLTFSGVNAPASISPPPASEIVGA